ncbi:hypothetical protein MMC28_011743 [Mycoblastus sanguinarius]|nr:hypothetical protein [Mycoblastus sanguinarius]
MGDIEDYLGPEEWRLLEDSLESHSTSDTYGEPIPSTGLSDPTTTSGSQDLGPFFDPDALHFFEGLPELSSSLNVYDSSIPPVGLPNSTMTTSSQLEYPIDLEPWQLPEDLPHWPSSFNIDEDLILPDELPNPGTTDPGQDSENFLANLPNVYGEILPSHENPYHTVAPPLQNLEELISPEALHIREHLPKLPRPSNVPEKLANPQVPLSSAMLDTAPRKKRRTAASSQIIPGHGAFQLDTLIAPKKKRAPFSQERREEIASMRKTGVCMRCKWLKSSVYAIQFPGSDF